MGDTFEGKVCIITGSSSGIGMGLAKELLKRGAVVYMSGWSETNKEYLQTTVKLLEKYPQKAFSQELDVRDERAVREYITAIAEKGPVDYMFSNAGVGMMLPFTKVDLKTWETVLNVDLYGVVHCVQTVVPIMLKQGHGHIVNTSSVAGIAPLPYQTVYCAAKYAVLGFSESLRYELEPYNIKVTVICPAAVATQIFQRTLDYEVHSDTPLPEEAITIDQAALEILEGVEAGRGILPITNWAREVYESISTDPAMNDARMRWLANRTRENFIAQGILKS